jgi:hypothetical protein
MRLFTSRRHYRCSRCQATMFVPKVLTVRTTPTTPAPAVIAPTLQPRPHPAQ